MPELISIRAPNGHRYACNASCYDARGHKCTCICGGLNHGKGYRKALENVRAAGDTMAKLYACQLELELNDFEVRVSEEVSLARPKRKVAPLTLDGYIVEDETGQVVNAWAMYPEESDAKGGAA